MSKIGLLLGSFDPIHIGHVTMASLALNSQLCEKVLFVVAKQNPWKERKATPFEVRVKMIEASIRHFKDRCSVCKLEKDIDPPTYSYKVLEAVRKAYPNDDFVIICGTDVIEKVHGWKSFDDRIKPYFSFIEIARDGRYNMTPSDEEMYVIQECNNKEIGNYKRIIAKELNISSGLIRELVRKNKTPYPYVNENVINIINSFNLYAI